MPNLISNLLNEEWKYSIIININIIFSFECVNLTLQWWAFCSSINVCIFNVYVVNFIISNLSYIHIINSVYMCNCGDLCLLISFIYLLKWMCGYIVDLCFEWSGMDIYLYIYCKCIRKLIIIHCNQVQVRREIWLFLVSAHHIFTLY